MSVVAPPPTRETVELRVAALRLGLSMPTAYRMVKDGTFPVPVLRFGRRFAVPTRAIDKVLGVEN